jgi:hypothetical protein
MILVQQVGKDHQKNSDKTSLLLQELSTELVLRIYEIKK